MVAGQFRDCTEEARTDREPGAIAGLDCTPPDGFSSLIIESFDNRADLRAAIENYADGLEKGGACEEIANRTLTLNYGATGVQTVNDTIANWRNVAPCGN